MFKSLEESVFSKVLQNEKISAVKTALEQTVAAFTDLILDLEELDVESKNCQSRLLTQIELCNSKSCQSSNELKKIIEDKDNIIQSVASSLTKLYESKNFNTISEVFKIICGEVDILTPPKDVQSNCKINGFISPKQEKSNEAAEQDQSMSEIENTPTGRKSPIIQSKMTKNVFTTPVTRVKKKCSDSWPTPEKKVILTFPTPIKSKTGGKLRQQKFNLSRFKQRSIVDLTSSPEIKTEKNGDNIDIMCNVKKEAIDDETILPSPTSGPVNFQLCKSKENLGMFKVPLTTKIIKDEGETKLNMSPVKSKYMSPLKENPKRYSSPSKASNINPAPNAGDESISLLQHVKILEEKENALYEKHPISPTKRPLSENLNIVNQLGDRDSSMSILQANPSSTKTIPALAIAQAVKNADNVNKRIKPDNGEPMYKEPTVRKKAEKKALPGWSCNECYLFYDELYKDDPEMLAKKMEECSKHRGKNNPVRPSTPGGYWNPRWDVPEDTEEFNRRNNAV